MTLFELLKKRMLKTPDKRFDREFWAKFNQEFETKSFWARFRFAIPATAMGFVLIAAMWFGYQKMSRVAPTADLLTQVEILKDLELLTAFDELPLTEEEWEELLPKGNQDG